MKKPFTLILLFLISAFSILYLVLLDLSWPYRGFQFQQGWADSTFETQFGDVAWIDSSFTEGWELVWASESSEGLGFRTEDGFAVLFANFTGYNYADEHGLTGVMIQRSLGEIDTRIYTYLSINHMESTSDYALSFSFALSDEMGSWHESGLRHTSKSSQNLEVDLRRIYNGTVKRLSIRFANDYDPSYDNGIHMTYLKQVVISSRLPSWILSYNEQVGANISTENSTMRIRATGNLTSSTIVTAQRYHDISFDLEEYLHLSIRIKTSSIAVAARVVVWTDSSHQYVVLLKTYNDANWHTEVVDLAFFGIEGEDLFLIELGMLQLYDAAESVVYYQQLSFNRLVV